MLFSFPFCLERGVRTPERERECATKKDKGMIEFFWSADFVFDRKTFVKDSHWCSSTLSILFYGRQFFQNTHIGTPRIHQYLYHGEGEKKKKGKLRTIEVWIRRVKIERNPDETSNNTLFAPAESMMMAQWLCKWIVWNASIFFTPNACECAWFFLLSLPPLVCLVFICSSAQFVRWIAFDG